MPRNRDIRGFFRASADNASAPSSQSRDKATTPSSLSSLPRSTPTLTPDLPSSPRTPPKAVAPRAPLGIDDEIKGSDDEADDSDDSLESITAFIGNKYGGPAPHQRDSNSVTTPRAKRIAVGFHQSPLTIQPKTHKFDLKSLMSHTRQDERTDESAKAALELINQDVDNSEAEAAGSDADDEDPVHLQETARSLFNVDGEEEKGDRIVRAMKRTKVDGSRKCCYFFKDDPGQQPLFNNRSPRVVFPKKMADPYYSKIFSPDTAVPKRNQLFINGLVRTLVSKGKTLPDELFLWILDEVCVEKNIQLRIAYMELVSLSPECNRRLINDMRLYAMLERIGGPKYAREHVKFESSTGGIATEESGHRRGWTGLETFLQLLQRIARDLKGANTISAIQLLLRMSLDPVVWSSVRKEQHAAAVQALILSLPESGLKWDTVCETICSYIYENIDEVVLRAIPIMCIPKWHPQLRDLTRRLAAETLFRQPGLGKRSLAGVLTAQAIRDRLDEEDFKINQSTTDFEELKALVLLLDIVIDNGAIFNPHPPSPATTTSPSSRSKTGKRLENNNSDTANTTSTTTTKDNTQDRDKAFDAEVDALTFKLKLIHDKIHDSNLVSRKEAKAVVDCVSRRLTYSIRTRPPPKTDIFDMSLTEQQKREARDEASLPKQKAFMQNWAAAQKTEKKKVEFAEVDEGIDGDIL